jgi:ABC-type dipeptide/oligopeptide/nickel transport system permease component
MFLYVFRRLLTAIPTLFVIVTISFFLMRVAPGGPFNQERRSSPRSRRICGHLRLDEPLWLQYLNYLEEPAARRFRPQLQPAATSPSPSCSRRACRSRCQLGASAYCWRS